MSFADTFKALSDPVRRDILVLLKDGRRSAGELGRHFAVAGPTISYHLSVLKKADLVFEQREKNFIYYQLNTSVVEELMLWLAELKGADNDGKAEGNPETVAFDRGDHPASHPGGTVLLESTSGADAYPFRDRRDS